MFGAAVTKGRCDGAQCHSKASGGNDCKAGRDRCEVEEFDDAVPCGSKGKLRHTQVKTLPYPGFPTDMQPQMGVALALCEGTSTITESIFENRFKYLDELARMGAVSKIEGILLPLKGWRNFPEPE